MAATGGVERSDRPVYWRSFKTYESHTPYGAKCEGAKSDSPPGGRRAVVRHGGCRRSGKGFDCGDRGSGGSCRDCDCRAPGFSVDPWGKASAASVCRSEVIPALVIGCNASAVRCQNSTGSHRARRNDPPIRLLQFDEKSRTVSIAVSRCHTACELCNLFRDSV